MIGKKETLINDLPNEEVLKYLLPIRDEESTSEGSLTLNCDSHETRTKVKNSHLVLIPVHVIIESEKNNKWNRIFRAYFSQNDLRFICDSLSKLEYEQLEKQIAEIPTNHEILWSEVSIPETGSFQSNMQWMWLNDDSDYSEKELVYQWIESIDNNVDNSASVVENANELNQRKPRWLHSERNPKVLNEYLKYLGVTNNDYEFVEIIGFDDELIAFVRQPVLK